MFQFLQSFFAVLMNTSILGTSGYKESRFHLHNLYFVKCERNLQILKSTKTFVERLTSARNLKLFLTDHTFSDLTTIHCRQPN